MDAVFTLRVRVADDSDVADIIERAKRAGTEEEAWDEVVALVEDRELPADALTVEGLEIIR